MHGSDYAPPSPAAPSDPEVAALGAVTATLDGLPEDAQRERVMTFLVSRYGAGASVPTTGRRGR